MYYVPTYNNGNCAVVYDKDTIRVYESTPSYNNDVNYIDYYVNSNYMSKSGVAHFNQYSTLPTCLASNKITTDFYYRNDFPQILLIFIILSIVIFYIPWKIFIRMFRRLN